MASSTVWRLIAHHMQQGDLVIVKGASVWTVMKIEGDYEFCNDPSQIPSTEYFHQRRASIQNRISSQKLWALSGGMAKDGGSIYRTLVRCVEAVESS